MKEQDESEVMKISFVGTRRWSLDKRTSGTIPKPLDLERLPESKISSSSASSPMGVVKSPSGPPSKSSSFRSVVSQSPMS